MPIKCSNKSCGHTNADGTSYCVKCGQLLGGMYEKIVVVKSEYDSMIGNVKDLELEKQQLNDKITTLINTDKVRIEQIRQFQKEVDRKREEEQNSQYYVVLVSPGQAKLMLVKRLKEELHLGLEEAKSLVDSAPSIVKRNMTKNGSENLRTLMENLGATVEIKCHKDIPTGFSIVNKSDYDRIYKDRQKIQKELNELKSKGYAPSGYRLQRDHIDINKLNRFLDEKTLLKSEYNELVRRANQSWYEKLWDTIQKWWDDTGGIIFLLLAFGLVICGAIWLTIGSIVSSCSSNIKIEQRDGLWGVTRGKDVVIPFECDSIISDKYDTKYSRIYKDGHVGLINNTSGKTIVPCIYLEVGEPDNVSFRGKLIAVKKDNGKWHFVDYHGLPKGRQDQYDYANWWSTAEYGIVGTIVNGEMKYGYVDERGDEKISCKYAAASDFFEGLALVKNAKYGPWICINKAEGEQYKLKHTLGDYYLESLMAVTNDSEWTSKTLFGFVDRKGELVIGMYFTPWVLDDNQFYMPRFNEGKAEVRYRGENGWIDKSGNFTPAKK